MSRLSTPKNSLDVRAGDSKCKNQIDRNKRHIGNRQYNKQVSFQILASELQWAPVSSSTKPGRLCFSMNPMLAGRVLTLYGCNILKVTFLFSPDSCSNDQPRHAAVLDFPSSGHCALFLSLGSYLLTRTRPEQFRGEIRQILTFYD